MKRMPHERLRELREKRGFETAKEAAEAFGWNVPTYRSHENGGRNIPVHQARKYALAYGSSPAYILGVSQQSSTGAAPAAGGGPVLSVPVQAQASAGSFRLDDGGFEYRGVTVPAVPRSDVPAGVQYAVEVDGPSVNLRIPNGAYAICAPYERMPGGAKHGQLVHVVRERAGLFEHTIKELQFTDKGRVLMPCSTDPRYQEPLRLESLEEGTTVTIKGIVIGAFLPL